MRPEVADLGGVGAQRGLGGESFAADGALEGPVLGALQLGVVVAQVLLQVRQLDEGPAALRNVASVRTLTCAPKKKTNQQK